MNSKDMVYSGKTKDIYKMPNGNLLMVFKDDVTGENGVADPGANSVMGQIKGKGRMSLEITDHFFRLFHERKIPTHLISVDLGRCAMEVKAAVPPGQGAAAGGLEFVCRLKAYGSFLRRYGKYMKEELKDLDRLVEITLKDDEQGDPLINDDTVVALGLLNREQLESAKDLTRRITGIVEEDLRGRGFRLVDMKIEFGLIDDAIALMDEVSADSMRVMDENGHVLSHEELHHCIFAS